MPAVTPKERQQISHKLKKMGFGGLDDRNIIMQIASLYRTHESFRGLLMSTAPDQRRIAYESLRPHLCFKAHPLDQYEREVKQRAEQEQWDIYTGGVYTEPFRVGEIETEEYRLSKAAERAIAADQAERAAKGYLSLTCAKCTRAESYPGGTRTDAAIAARKAGWTLVPKALCKECAELYLTVQ